MDVEDGGTGVEVKAGAGDPGSPGATARRCMPGGPAWICILLGKTVQMGSGCSGRIGVRQIGVTTVAVLESTWVQRVKVWVLVET